MHLLPIRGHLAHLLPSWGRHPWVGGHWLCLFGARSSWCPGPSGGGSFTPTNTGSSQQVLRSRGWEHVHWDLLGWRQPGWWAPLWRHSAGRGASCSLRERGHSSIAHHSRVNRRQPCWQVSLWWHPTHRGAGCGLSGRGHGRVAHHWGCPYPDLGWGTDKAHCCTYTFCLL